MQKAWQRNERPSLRIHRSRQRRRPLRIERRGRTTRKDRYEMLSPDHGPAHCGFGDCSELQPGEGRKGIFKDVVLVCSRRQWDQPVPGLRDGVCTGASASGHETANGGRQAVAAGKAPAVIHRQSTASQTANPGARVESSYLYWNSARSLNAATHMQSLRTSPLIALTSCALKPAATQGKAAGCPALHLEWWRNGVLMVKHADPATTTEEPGSESFCFLTRLFELAMTAISVGTLLALHLRMRNPLFKQLSEIVPCEACGLCSSSVLTCVTAVPGHRRTLPEASCSQAPCEADG